MGLSGTQGVIGGPGLVLRIDPDVAPFLKGTSHSRMKGRVRKRSTGVRPDGQVER